MMSQNKNPDKQVVFTVKNATAHAILKQSIKLEASGQCQICQMKSDNSCETVLKISSCTINVDQSAYFIKIEYNESCSFISPSPNGYFLAISFPKQSEEQIKQIKQVQSYVKKNSSLTTYENAMKSLDLKFSLQQHFPADLKQNPIYSTVGGCQGVVESVLSMDNLSGVAGSLMKQTKNLARWSLGMGGEDEKKSHDTDMQKSEEKEQIKQLSENIAMARID